MIPVTEVDGRARFRLKVVPGASRNRIMGEIDGALKIAVSAPPERGRANKAVLSVLARSLGFKPGQLSIDSGTTSQYKTCVVSGATADEVRSALGSIPGAS